MAATLTGIVFNDINHNGQFDPGEPGIPNVFVVLFSNTGGTCIPAQTDVNGIYSFTVTVAGTYTVYEPVANPGATCPPSTFTQPSGFTMSNGPRKITITVTAAQISSNATIANQNFSHDTTNNPLSCNSRLIQFAGRPSIRYSISVVTGTATVLGTVSPPVDINAIGYNPLDNYIYGYDQLNNNIVRVDNSGNVTALFPLPTGFPADAYTTGTFDLNGFLYLFVNNNSKFYVVDLRPNSATFMKLVNPANGFAEQTSNFGVALSAALNVSDWIINPSDNNLYGITPTGIVERIIPTTGKITDLTTTPHNTGPFGAIATDATGTIYAISNQTGNIFRYTIVGNNATAAQFSTTVTTSFNDATMCPLATVNIDFGDAPDTAAGNGPDNYSTVLAKNGPRHELVNDLLLGTQVTAEPDALQNATATGDDIPKDIQDDGLAVPLPALPINATSYSLNVTVINNTGSPANLYGWVDFNGDGIFQGNEASPVQVVSSQPGTQTIPITFTVPSSGVTLSAGHTFVRLRLTTDNLVNQNAASVTSVDTRTLGPASDGEVEDYIVQIAAPAELALTKTVTPTSAAPGDVVQYTFTVSNPGIVTLTNVLIEDSTLGLIDILSSLPVGSSVVLNASFTVPAGTPADTVITNTATATSDQTGPAIATAQVTVLPVFSMAVTKTSDRISVAPGETVTYTLTVTNTSNAAITNVTVTDALLGFTQNIPLLSAGESLSFMVLFTIPPGTPSGTVFTNLTTATSNETGPASDTATVIVTPVPNLVIFKTVTPQIAAPGDTVTYTLTATNAGNSTLTNVRIVDPTLGINQTFVTVNPGDSVIVTIPFVVPLTAMQGETLVNVATATADQTGPSQADAVVTVIGVPDIAITKSVSPEQSSPGNTVTYTFLVSNTGNTVLSNVTLTDPTLGLIQSIGTLAVGESRTVDFPFVIPNTAVSPFNNTATATGNFNTQAVQNSSSASLDVLLPAFTVTKSVDQSQVNPGDTVNFTFTIVNTGGIALTNVAVSDPLLSYFNLIASLAPGASVTETIPFVIPDDAAAGSSITNVVTVSPTETGPQQGTSTVTVNQVPAISLTKTSDRDNALPGDLITYTVIVTNTGNVNLTNVVVSDPLLGLNAAIPTLPVGQSQTFTLTFTVPPGTIVGTVIMNTSTANSDQTASVQASANVLINGLPAELTVVKTPDRLIAAPGDTVTYTVTVSNPGTVVLTDVVLTDALLGIAQTIGTLNPGQSLTFTFLFTIPADAPNGSVIVNTVVATSDQTNPQEDTSNVTVDPSPGLTITKTIDPAQAAPGQTAIATIVVRNTGNVDLTNVVIADTTLDFRSVLPTLPAGSTVSIPIPFVTPNVPAGTILSNTATAFSDETGQTSATATITVLPEFQLSLIKSVNPSIGFPGDSVTFTFTIQNSSNAPLTDLRFTDDLLGIDKTVNLIPPGFFIILSRTFTIPEDARGGTVITNTAVLSSAETSPVSSTVQVTVADNPQLTISKTVFPTIAIPGEVVFFRLEGINTGNVPLVNIRYSDPLFGINGIVAMQDVGVAIAIIIPFTVPATASPGDTIVNTVLTDSVQTGPLSTAATLRIVGLPLSVTKRSDVDLVFVGENIRFTITVANTSTLATNNVILTDALQAGTQFVPNSVTVGGSSVAGANPEAGIPLGNLAPGQTVQVSFQAIQLILPPNDRVQNQAAVSFQLANTLQRFTINSNLLVITVEEHEE
ncbi:DUF7507 domain-containing protein [Cohnella herbarum]|uniref:DUF11 domain-containing protein n=1 Tax=Cohnella herbarum TaxID=2728023 RepID=A0A7Z2ZKL2_9BACL|nr:SdrD B-like domain-containing protein [Cohnella herbarum]QJD82955.1 DUF11 domain-containing protein [Cohnella herbarum]